MAQWSLRCAVGFVLMSFSCCALSAELVRARAPDGVGDYEHEYFFSLLKLALENAGGGERRYVVQYAPAMPEERALRQLERNKKIDVYWARSSSEREEKLQAVQVPLLRGLLGYRVGIVHKDAEPGYSAVKSVFKLLRYRPCQEAGSADGVILSAAGFEVVSNPSHEAIFKQTNMGRCDFFPLGVLNVGSEFEGARQKYLNLRMSKHVVLFYPAPVYFFVNKGSAALAESLRRGLEKAIDDGDFSEVLEGSRLAGHLFPLSRLKEAKLFELQNPLLPDELDIDNPRYWYPRKLSAD